MVTSRNRAARAAPADGKAEGRIQRPARRRPAGFRPPPPGRDGNGRKGAQVKAKGDLEELKEAMEEYEMTRGDWSKSR